MGVNMSTGGGLGEMHVNALFYSCLGKSGEERSQDAHKTERFKHNAIYRLFTVLSGKSVSHRIMSAYCTDDTAV